jgi:hypothetical protein
MSKLVVIALTLAAIAATSREASAVPVDEGFARGSAEETGLQYGREDAHLRVLSEGQHRKNQV